MNSAVTHQAQPRFDEDGLLVDTTAWNEELAREIAEHYGIGELTAAHWRAIFSLRDYYLHFGVAPAMHNLCRQLGQDPHWVQDLFQSCLNAWRVAGLPNPGEEAKAYFGSAGPEDARRSDGEVH
jgi:tRNA 2-thiouridine synthesizing protein E